MPSLSPARGAPRRPSRSVRFRLLAPVIGVLLLGLPAACQDAASGPLGVVITPETRAALSLPVSIPVLPELLHRAAEEGEGALSPGRADELAGRWEATWLAGEAEGSGAETRAELYRTASGSLADALGAEGLAGALDRLERGIATARDAPAEVELPSYEAKLEAASERAREAREHLSEGRDEAAVEAVLLGADRLRSLTAVGVARDLIGRAEAAWRRSGTGDSYTEEERRRIDRLLRGARTALHEGDLGRAIQRGFYACRLLGVELP